MLPDGGPLFRDVLDAGAAGPADWLAAVERYPGCSAPWSRTPAG
ncbi:hypothetical protein [Streptomyces sp. NPDC053367]